jgi:miniconductance mechanosensitive channel
MEEAGIRQIKRAIFIDVKSIRFLDNELRVKLCNIPVMKEYIESFEKSGLEQETSSEESLFFNASRLTNLGVFRHYAETFIKQHPLIDKQQAFLVRHRPPEVNGLPLQILAFTSNNQMVPYENVQSEIFEHFLAIISEFGLKVFQQPTGDDLLASSRMK